MRTVLKPLSALVLLGGLIWIAVTSPSTFTLLRGDEAMAPIHATRQLDRGKTLFAIGGCASCHMSPDQEDRTILGGGLALKTAFGTFHAPNISSDPVTGLGMWTEQNFIRAMREGVSPDGRHYYPAFPYPSYRNMTPDDLADLFAYLKTLPAVTHRAPDHDLPFPFNIRRGLGLWKLAFLDAKAIKIEGDTLESGHYLVEGPGHCGECHTPRNLMGAVRKEMKFSGAPDAEARGWVPNITPHTEGLAAWSEDEIAELLKTGFTPEFDAIGGSMVDVVKNTSQLNDKQRLAIARYLKSLPPQKGLEKPVKVQAP